MAQVQQIKEKVFLYRSQLDEELKKVKQLDILEAKVKNVPFIRAYAVLGVAGLVLLLIAVGVASDFLTEIIGTVYPAYVSLRLAQSREVSQSDRQQWFTYWIVYGLFDILAFFEDILFGWLPLLDLFKVAFFIWLFAPTTRGAELLFNKAFKPLLAKLDGQRSDINAAVDAAVSNVTGKKDN